MQNGTNKSYKWWMLALPIAVLAASLALPANASACRASGPDRDGDGLTNCVERRETHTNVRDADTDDDGLSDGIEHATGTDPLNPDTDDDGYSDSEEILSCGDAGQNPTAGDTGTARCPKTETTIYLSNVGPDADAIGKVEFGEERCNPKFSVSVKNLPAGSYDLFVGSALRGTIVVSGRRELEGEIEFRTKPHGTRELPLTFDPAGQLVEVSQGGTIYLSRTLPN